MIRDDDFMAGASRKHRLILHAGTSKTGSTSLQTYLDHHRTALKAAGFLYPLEGVREGWMPKHQWLVNAIIDEDRAEFDRRMQAVLAECDASTHTILLSTEGIANHWWDFSSGGLSMIAALRQQFDVSCWIWFREPQAFFKSYYLQIMNNGRHPRFQAYGQDWSPLEMLNTPWVAKHLDYASLLNSIGQLLGEDEIYPFAYTTDIIRDLRRLLPVPLPYEPGLKVNTTTTTSTGLALLRLVNRLATTHEKKQAALSLAAQLTALLSDESDVFELAPEEKVIIAELNGITSASLAAMGEHSFARWKKRFVYSDISETN